MYICIYTYKEKKKGKNEPCVKALSCYFVFISTRSSFSKQACHPLCWVLDQAFQCLSSPSIAEG